MTRGETQAMAADQSFDSYSKPTRCDGFLETMEAIVPWSSMCAVIEFYPNAGNGRPPLGLERMLRIHFIQLVPTDRYGLRGSALRQLQPASLRRH